MQTTLEGARCRYEVVRPPATSDRFEIQRLLYAEAAKCEPDDTLLVYFAGHGMIHGGGLTLLLDATVLDHFLLSTAVPAQDVMRALQDSRAKHKILILDCCNAGTLAKEMGLRSERVPMEELGVKSENFDILLASDHLEFARELELVEGGFFTSSICSAITTDFDDVDLNGDGALSVDEVSSWLETCADNHNTKYPNWQVHMPRRLGFGHGKTFLTLPPDAWFIHEFLLPDGAPAVVLPVRPIEFHLKNQVPARDDWSRIGAGDLAIALARYPVTNRAYSRFVEATGYRAPSGKQYDLERGWVGPFSPWSDPKFSDPDQPVVCVTGRDVRNYCDWLGEQAGNCFIGPPMPAMWDVAAFGISNPDRLNPRVWLSTSAEMHHKSAAPQPCKDALARTNSRGYTDMIGNVWEWCARPEAWGDVLIPYFIETQTLGPQPPVFEQLRGGGFLDDLERVTPFINVSELPDRENTSHADLGFRVAVLMRIEEFPPEIIEMAMRCRPLYPKYFAPLIRV